MRLSSLYSLLLALNMAGFPVIAGLALVVGVSSTPLSIVLRVLIIVLSGLLVVLALLRKQTALLRGWYWLPILVFWLAYLMRLFLATATESHLLSRPGQDYWIWALGACLLPMLGLLVIPNDKAWTGAYRASLIMLLIATVIVVVLGGTFISPIDGGGAYDTGRLRLDSLNPISVGHLGASLMLLSWWPMVSRGFSTSRAQRICLAISSLIGLYALVAAASRGPIVSLILVGAFHISALGIRRAWKFIVLFAAVMVFGYMVVMHFQESGQFSTLARIASVSSGQDAAVSERQQALSGALQQIGANPLLGYGLEERTTGFYPHNVVVESFMATGFIGGVSFLAIIAFGVGMSLRVLRGGSQHGWVALIFLQYLVAAQFSGAIYSVTIFWAFLGAIISLGLSLGSARSSHAG